MPENYIVRFARSQLVANPEGQAVSSSGRPRGLLATDHRPVPAAACPSGADQTYRAVATRLPEGRGALLGPFQVWGMRRDDPNDIVPHEHRRDLRGLSVFEAWVNNANARAVGTQDILTTVGGVTRIRHYLVDFTRSLGSGIRGRSEAIVGGQRAVVSRAGHDRAQHRQHGHRDAGMDEGALPGPSRGRRVRGQHVRPGGVDDEPSDRTVCESPARRHVLGRAPGHGVHRRRDSRHRPDGSIQQGGRGLDHRGTRRAAEPDRTHVFCARVAARPLSRSGAMRWNSTTST